MTLRHTALTLLLLASATAAAAPEYPSPADVDDALRALLSAHGDSASLLDIGVSRGGQPIRALLFGAPGDVPLAERPRLLVVAGLAGDHRVGTATALLLPERLLAGEDPVLAETLRHTAVEIVPLANPDGLAALLAGPEREFRRNISPLDDDRDGRVDEDGPADLDGDGRITTMRVPDAAGAFRPSPEDARLLVRADPGRFERGGYRVYVEGLDRDGDGSIAEDGPGGIDLERNFPYGGDRYDLSRGPSQPSEPESRALADHLLANPRIAAVLVYGRHDNLSATWPANRAQGRAIFDGPVPEDVPVFAEASNRFRAAMGDRGGVWDPPAGAFHHYAYFCRGLPAFAAPLFWAPPSDASPLPSGAKAVAEDARWLAFSDGPLGGSGFTPWKAFKHPTLGDVEIGGLAPLLSLNPPADRLPDIAGRQAKFVGDLLALFPRPALRMVSVTPLGNGAFEVRAILVNEGAFPFGTSMGERNRAQAPLRVTLVPATAIVSGPPRTLVPRGEDGAETFRWVVSGKAGDRLSVRVECERFPTVSAEVTL